MPDKKKQHYVPRFYLRNFSWEEKKAINIYNIKSSKLIKNGNLSNQCYEPYFYGKNLVLESSLSDLESVAANIIASIIKTNEVPRPNTQDHHTLMVHTLFQFSRTKYAAEAYSDMAEKLMKTTLEKEGSIDKNLLNKVKIKLKTPTTLSLGSMAQCIPVVMDLKFKVLINITKLQFLSSDNPVVFYNQCYEKSKVGSSTGLATRGLEIFFPLSPRHLLTLYDSAAYKMGERKSDNCDVLDLNDVRQLNDLQWLNCLENVYFHRGYDLSEIYSAEQRNTRRKIREKSILDKYPEEQQPDGSTSSILHMYSPDHKINLALNCIRQRLEIPTWELDFVPKAVRDKLLCQLTEKFIKLVDEGRYKASEFPKFVSDLDNESI